MTPEQLKKSKDLKSIFAVIAFAGLTAGPAFAGELSEQLRPVAALSGTWTGPYAGVSSGRTTSKTPATQTTTEIVPGEEIRICSSGRLGAGAVCHPTGSFLPDTTVTSTKAVTIETQTTEAGGFAGYRHALGTFVIGVEASTNAGLNALELHGGLGLGPVLTYAFAGYGAFDGDDGTAFGLGADMRVGSNGLVGIKLTQGEFGSSDLEQTTLRVGWQF